jgi:hypothetical protein
MFLLGAALAAAPLCHAGRILTVPSSPSVATGSIFSLTLSAEDLNLGGYSLELEFQPLLASLVAIDFGDRLGAPLSFADGSAALDRILLDEVSFADGSVLLSLQGPAASGNLYPLVTLKFQALAVGTASFTFLSGDLTDFSGSPLSAALDPASVLITAPSVPSGGAVPEPGSWLLLASGLALAGTRRRLSAWRASTVASGR